MIDRNTIEQDHDALLAPWAASPTRTQGRQHPEPEHPYRTCYQRDKDRIIHASAFRRLEAKTQVFLGHASDHARTRLTHTIEVAQIARTIARVLRANEDLAEAAALAHDLGHPPYGHCGEAALNALMTHHGGFEHNAHALRLVEYLEHPYPAFRGLNLTFETRLCIAKHNSRYDHPAETPDFSQGGPCLEGQIVDLADAIAYNSHDLDDALTAEIIREQDLDDIELYQRARRQIEKLYPAAKPLARQLRTSKALIDLLVTQLLQETTRRLQQQNPKTLDDLRQLPEPLAAIPHPWQRMLDQLADFLHKNVYHHPDLQREAAQAENEIAALFQLFLENPQHLPPRYQQRLNHQSPHRVTCDYLAGMTDRYCHHQYLALTK